MVLGDEGVFVDGAEDVTGGEGVAGADGGGEFPGLGVVQGEDVDPAGDVDGVGEGLDGVEGTLDAVKDLAHDPGTEFEAEGGAGAVDRVPDTDPAGLFVDLDCGGVALETDDFPDEFVVSHTNEFVHGTAGHVDRNNYGTADTLYRAQRVLRGILNSGVPG